VKAKALKYRMPLGLASLCQPFPFVPCNRDDAYQFSILIGDATVLFEEESYFVFSPYSMMPRAPLMVWSRFSLSSNNWTNVVCGLWSTTVFLIVCASFEVEVLY